MFINNNIESESSHDTHLEYAQYIEQLHKLKDIEEQLFKSKQSIDDIVKQLAKQNEDNYSSLKMNYFVSHQYGINAYSELSDTMRQLENLISWIGLDSTLLLVNLAHGKQRMSNALKRNNKEIDKIKEKMGI